MHACTDACGEWCADKATPFGAREKPMFVRKTKQRELAEIKKKM
jgi:hypothetical protein